MSLLSFKKTLFIAGSALFLAACQPKGPDIEALQKLRDADSGIEITNSRIKSVMPINDTLALYDIEGMYKYRDGRYQYLTNLGDIKIYTPLNETSTEPFNAAVVASEVEEGWNIIEENLPVFSASLGSTQAVVNHTTLFKESEEQMPGFFTHNDGTLFALNDKALDKSAKLLVKRYEADLKTNAELDKKLIDVEEDLQSLSEELTADAKKSLSAQKLQGSALEAKLAETLAQTFDENSEYQGLLADKTQLETQIQALHQTMPKLWSMTACNDTSYRFYGRICNQIMGANRSYLPEIRYSQRPDADLQYLK